MTGKHAVRLFLKPSVRYRVLSVDVSSAFVNHPEWPEFKEQMDQAIIKYRIRPAQSIQDRAGGASSQGVLAKVALRVGHISMLDEWLVDGRRCLILDHLQDPHNVGACLRTALAFGFDVVVIAKHGACDITPAVAKVAVGALGQIDVVEANINQAIAKIQSLGMWVMASSEHAQLLLDDVNVPENVAWVVGNEEKGVSHQVKKLCDQLVRINTNEDFPSLNVSVATGILLHKSKINH